MNVILPHAKVRYRELSCKYQPTLATSLCKLILFLVLSCPTIEIDHSVRFQFPATLLQEELGYSYSCPSHRMGSNRTLAVTCFEPFALQTPSISLPSFNLGIQIFSSQNVTSRTVGLF